MAKSWIKVRNCVVALYNDRFCWSFFKSYFLFLLAVRCAKTIRA
ncbi:uncharacterized protein Dvir_GJ26254 [Drosophila virilis]|uniref:Uncharacterized protein n=1 Tax=Drosophila virilis TaxID=7244 RepID=A0A0Q9WKV7_DROVI|nr:uncharacterized protein Dvir_GJ26254 [Drosophila virilis]